MADSSTTATDSEFSEFLEQYHACAKPRPWAARCSTIEEAWKICTSPEPLIWGLKQAGFEDPQPLRLWACWCVRQVLPLMTEPESRQSLEIAEQFIQGNATAEELAAAAELAKPVGERAWPTLQPAWAARAAAELATLRPVAAAPGRS